MRQPKTYRSKRGFTLAELLVGMVATSVIALTCGVMLTSAYRAWARGREAVDLHRDAEIVMTMLNSSVRPAEPVHLRRTGANVLRIRGNGVRERYRRRGSGNFEFDPDTNVDNDEIILVYGNMTSFSTTPLANGLGLQVQFTLADMSADERTQITATIAHRN